MGTAGQARLNGLLNGLKGLLVINKDWVEMLRLILVSVLAALTIIVMLNIAHRYDTMAQEEPYGYHQNQDRVPPPPQSVGGPPRAATPLTLSEPEKRLILEKTSNDPLVKSLISKGGLKKMGVGIIVTEKGSKIGGCAGVMLKNTVWVDIEYKSISGASKKYSGLTDNIIVCVNTISGEVIGYYIEPKSLVVEGPEDLQKEVLDPETRLKLSTAINYVKDYMLKEYGVEPPKYKIKGAKNGVLFVRAYIDGDGEGGKGTLYEVKVVVFKFRFEDLKVISIYEDVVTVVDSRALVVGGNK